MKYTTLLALSAPLLVVCKPMAHERLHHHHKRDGDIITSTSTVWEEVTVTIDVTVTVYAPPSNPHQQKEEIHPDKPKDNVAKSTPAVQPAPVVKQDAPKPPTTPPPPPIPSPSPQPAPQQPAPAPAPQVQAPSSPPPKQPEQKQPDPPKKDSDKGASAPSGGGSCGEVGGKCMASDVTIYNDQGTGACGWQNDTNTEDYFALAITQWDGFTNDAPGPHKNKWCGRMATISVGGKKVEGMLTDKCPGCTGWSIDLSLSLWNKLYNNEAPTRKHQIEYFFSSPEVYHGPGY